MQLTSLLALSLSAASLAVANPISDLRAKKVCNATEPEVVHSIGGKWNLYCNTQVGYGQEDGGHFYAVFENIQSHGLCMRTCYQNGKEYGMSTVAIEWNPPASTTDSNCYCYDEPFSFNEAMEGYYSAYFIGKKSSS